jgi:Family of unknown function (DUF6967)
MEPVNSRLLESFDLPFGQRVDLFEVTFEGDVRLLRLRIKEKSRFTQVDLDPVTARSWGGSLREWADRQDIGKNND